jgi:hypothetical protein
VILTSTPGIDMQILYVFVMSFVGTGFVKYPEFFPPKNFTDFFKNYNLQNEPG